MIIRLLLSVFIVTGILSSAERRSFHVYIPVTNDSLLFEKILGTWVSENGKNFERWTRKTDGTYASDVYFLNNADTTWKERAHIYREKNTWVFENNVAGQNDGKSVRFISTILTEKTVQFSNPSHDFPTDVNYTLKDINTIHAFIIGPNKNGGRDTIPFNYKRVVK